MNYIHMAMSEKRPGIPELGSEVACKKENCTGPDNLEHGFGLAGGGYGPYTYCQKCDKVTGKDVEQDE